MYKKSFPDEKAVPPPLEQILPERFSLLVELLLVRQKMSELRACVMWRWQNELIERAEWMLSLQTVKSAGSES